MYNQRQKMNLDSEIHTIIEKSDNSSNFSSNIYDGRGY